MRDALLWWGFFAQKSLIVAYGIPKDLTYWKEAYTSSEIEDFLKKNIEHIPSDNILILVSYKPDKRTSGYKFFSKQTTLKQFSPLKTPALLQLIHEKSHWKLSSSDITYLLEIVWTDAWNIVQECKKLIAYADFHSKEKISREDIDHIVVRHTQHDNFKILDTILTDPQNTLLSLQKAQDQWTNIFELMWLLLRWLKLLIGIADHLEQWITSSKDIASSLKAHPFAVKKHLSKSVQLTKKSNETKKLYSYFLEVDRKIKTGQLPAESHRVLLKKAISEM